MINISHYKSFLATISNFAIVIEAFPVSMRTRHCNIQISYWTCYIIIHYHNNFLASVIVINIFLLTENNFFTTIHITQASKKAPFTQRWYSLNSAGHFAWNCQDSGGCTKYVDNPRDSLLKSWSSGNLYKMLFTWLAEFVLFLFSHTFAKFDVVNNFLLCLTIYPITVLWVQFFEKKCWFCLCTVFAF